MAAANPSDRFLALPPISTRLALAALAALALIVFFRDAFANLWSRWGGSEELSHMYFIPVISAWLVWTNRDAVRRSVGAPSMWGVGFIALAGGLGLLGKVTHIFVLQQLGVVAGVAGLVAGFGGASLLRATAAPIAFLLFAVPPPFWVQSLLSWKFQQMSSIIGVWMIELMNIPVFLSGNIIDLGEYKLEVAEACSGLRYLFPFISIGVMAAYLYRGPLWGKAVIVASTIPITILMNSFRIAVTGALVNAYGTSHAEGALHFFEGWVVFVLCLFALFGVVVVINQFVKPKRNALDSIGAPELAPVPPSAGLGKSTPVAAGLAAAALALIGLAQLVNTDALITPERTRFAALPSEFPDYRTQVKPLDETVAQVLGADDTIVVNMTAPDGEFFNIYLAYLEAQRDGRSWHSPRQCIPGGGWEITTHEMHDHPYEANGRYNRLIIEHRNQRQLVYYWFDQRGRTIADETRMKFLIVWDAVTKKRSDGAMVRILTPIKQGESIEDADERLLGLMGELHEVLPTYVPQ